MTTPLPRPGASLARRPWRRLASRWDDVGRWRVHSRVLTMPGSLAGPWAVLVHGLGVSGRYLTPLALALAPRFRVAVPDLPGHGRTDRRGPSLGVAAQATVLARWLDVVGIRGPALVANSFGCQVALELAATGDPDLRDLVLVGPTMDPAASSLAQGARLLLGAVHESPALVALVAVEQLHRPTQGVRELRTGLAHDLEATARRVSAPVTLIRGARDRVAPRRWLDQLATWLPHARVVDLPVGAHAIHASHPARVASVVDP